ncbi:retrotransposon protein, putative, ty1-copia subclass [Tanacetum coccineum]
MSAKRDCNGEYAEVDDTNLLCMSRIYEVNKYYCTTLWANNKDVVEALNMRKGMVNESWLCNVDMEFNYRTYDYLFKPCPDEPPEDAAENVKATWKAEYNIHSCVACLMVGRISPALQRQFELHFPQAMLDELRRMFKKPRAVEIYDLVDTLHSCKQAPGKSVSAHVLEMKGYMDQLQALGKPYDNDMAINLINRDLEWKGSYPMESNTCMCEMERKQLAISVMVVFEIEHEDNVSKLAILARLRMQKLLREGIWNRRDYDLEDDHMDTLPSKNTSEIPVEPESLGPPPELIPVGRSERTTHAPNHLCLNMEVEDDVVGDLGEPANYKAAMLDPDKVIWQGAMDEEMNSMKVNEVWTEVDPPPNAKIVRSKWLFKKKTDMDGQVHTYKARLVAKGHTQTYGIDYEETFSPVADIRAIRILIAIAAYYDYEIWQMDVKTSSEMVRLDEDIYMEQPEGYVNPRYPNRVCKLQRSIYGLKQASRQWNKRFDEEIKKFGFTQNRDEPCVYRKASGVKCGVCSKLGQSISTESREAPLDDTKSQTGYVFVVNGGALDWKSKKQTMIAMSAAQAEYMAVSEAAMEAVWIRKFVRDLGVMPSIKEPINMYCDNSAAIIFANDSGIMKGARHFLRRYHFVREQVESGEIKILKVHTDDNLADPFTKALPRGKGRTNFVKGSREDSGTPREGGVLAGYRCIMTLEIGIGKGRLKIPEWKWEGIAMDFVTKLSRTSSGHDTFWVIVDRLTKSAHFLPMREDFKMDRLARLYMNGDS